MTQKKTGGLSRRDLIGYGTAAVATVAAGAGLAGCRAATPRRIGSSAPGAGAFASFGVDERLVREALAAALSRGGDWADLFFQHSVVQVLRLEQGQLHRSMRVELGVGVRVLSDGESGYAFSDELSRESVIHAAQTAAAVADAHGHCAPPRVRVEPHRLAPSPRTLPQEVPAEQKEAILRALADASFAADPRVREAAVRLEDASSAVLIADSEGRLLEDLRARAELSLRCDVELHGRRESGQVSVAGRSGCGCWSSERTAALPARAVQRALARLDAGEPFTGELPIVLAAGSGGLLLHEAIGHALEADYSRRGLSPFARRLGKRVADPLVSLVDDATLEPACGGPELDDEGNPGVRAPLVDRGVLAGFLHDHTTARHFRTRQTGHGRRQSYQWPPAPRMRLTCLMPGPHGRDEIIASVDRGLYCESFAEPRVEPSCGDFSLVVRNGRWIEDGRLARPVKDVLLKGNGAKVLAAIDRVGDDLKVDDCAHVCGKQGQRVPVAVGLPTVRIATMIVAGTARNG